MRLFLKSSFLAAILLFLAGQVWADDVYWVGGTGNWSTAGNWNTNYVPTSDDDVHIEADNSNVSIDSDDVYVKSLFVSGNNITIQPLYDISTEGDIEINQDITISADITIESQAGNITFGANVTISNGASVTFRAEDGGIMFQGSLNATNTSTDTDQGESVIFNAGENIEINDDFGDIYTRFRDISILSGRLTKDINAKRNVVVGADAILNTGNNDAAIIGKDLTVAGSMACSGSNSLIVYGNIVISGLGSLDVPEEIQVAGDWVNYGEYLFTPNSKVTFMHPVDDDGAEISPSISEIKGETLFQSFECTVEGKTLKLESGKTQTVSTSMVLEGDTGSHLILTSTNGNFDSSTWFTLDTGPADVDFSYVDISYGISQVNLATQIEGSDNSDAQYDTYGQISTMNFFDFSGVPTEFTWTGAVDTNWWNKGNWDSLADMCPPPTSQTIIIENYYDSSGNHPSLTTNITYPDATITIGADSALICAGYNIEAGSIYLGSDSYLHLLGTETIVCGSTTTALSSTVKYYGDAANAENVWPDDYGILEIERDDGNFSITREITAYNITSAGAGNCLITINSNISADDGIGFVDPVIIGADVTLLANRFDFNSTITGASYNTQSVVFEGKEDDCEILLGDSIGGSTRLKDIEFINLAVPAQDIAIAGNLTFTNSSLGVGGATINNTTSGTLTIDAGDKNIDLGGKEITTGTLKVESGVLLFGASTITALNMQVNGGTLNGGDSTIYSGASVLITGGNFYLEDGTIETASMGISGGTFTCLNSSSRSLITINGGLSISGGTFNCGGETISIISNLQNTGGTFNAGTSTVEFKYASSTSIISGISTFYNLTCTEAGKTIKLQENATITIDTLTLTGSTSNKIILTSASSAPSIGNENTWFEISVDVSKISIEYTTITYGKSVNNLTSIVADAANNNNDSLYDGTIYSTFYFFNTVRMGSFLSYSFTEDLDGNGRIDSIRIQFTDSVQGDLDNFEIEVTGYTVDFYEYVLENGSISASGPAPMIRAHLVEGEDADTAARPHWSLINAGSVVGLYDLPVRQPAELTEVTPVDTAPARILYTLAVCGTNTVYIKWSEPALGDLDDIPLTEGYLGYTVLSALRMGNGDEYLLTLDRPLDILDVATDKRFDVNALFRDNDWTDDSVPDWGYIPPSITNKNVYYPANAYDYSDFNLVDTTEAYPGNIPSGLVDPAGKILVQKCKAWATGRRISDVVVLNEPSASMSGGTVWPSYAKNDGVMTQVNQWDGNGTLQVEGIILDIFSGISFDPLEIIYGIDIPSEYRKDDKKDGLWLPKIIPNTDINYNVASEITLTKSFNAGKIISTRKIDAKNYMYSFDESDGITNGTFDFILKLPARIPATDPPLYAVRLDKNASGTLSNKIKPFSFTITGAPKQQKGGVTIINNVVNPEKGGSARIYYNLKRSGRVTINVFTLDGKIVKTLVKESKSAGENYFAEWDGRNNNGNAVSRGLYFIRIVGPDIDETRKIMVVK